MNGDGEERSHVNSANAIAWANQNSDVSLLAPVSAPGIFDDPVLLVSLGICPIADEEHRMIKVWRASLVVVNNSALILEPL